MEVLASKLDEQTQMNDDLRALFGCILNKKFVFDESTQENIRGLKTALNELSIPDEVKIKKSLDIGQAAKQFLVWWGTISFAVTAVCIWFAVTAYKDYYQPSKLEQEQRQWLIEYAKEMKEKNPKTHDSYLEKYPFPK